MCIGFFFSFSFLFFFIWSSETIKRCTIYKCHLRIWTNFLRIYFEITYLNCSHMYFVVKSFCFLNFFSSIAFCWFHFALFWFYLFRIIYYFIIILYTLWNRWFKRERKFRARIIFAQNHFLFFFNTFFMFFTHFLTCFVHFSLFFNYTQTLLGLHSDKRKLKQKKLNFIFNFLEIFYTSNEQGNIKYSRERSKYKQNLKWLKNLVKILRCEKVTRVSFESFWM